MLILGILLQSIFGVSLLKLIVELPVHSLDYLQLCKPLTLKVY